MLGIFSRCNILANQLTEMFTTKHTTVRERGRTFAKASTTIMILEPLVLQFWSFVSHHATTDYESRSSTGAEFIQGEEGRDKKLNKQITACTAVQRHIANDSLSQVKRFMWGTNDIIATVDGGGRKIRFRKLQFTFQNIKYIQTS